MFIFYTTFERERERERERVLICIEIIINFIIKFQRKTNFEFKYATRLPKNQNLFSLKTFITYYYFSYIYYKKLMKNTVLYKLRQLSDYCDQSDWNNYWNERNS